MRLTTQGLRVLALTITVFIVLVGLPIYHTGAHSKLIAPGAAQARSYQDATVTQASPIFLTDGQERYLMGLHLDILEDPSGTLTIKEVSSPAYNEKFIPSQVPTPVYGLTKSVYWTRLELDNETSQTTEWMMMVDFANMHYVDLFTPQPNGQGFSVKQTGILRPVSSRDTLFPRIVFSIDLPIHARQIYYLRFQSDASMTLGMTLWSMQAFMDRSQKELLYFGALFGLLFALLVYHIFLWVSLKDLNYLFFVLLLACLLLTLLIYQGYMAAFLLPNVNAMSLYVFPFTDAGVYLMIVLFSATFLELKTRIPKLYWVNIGVAGVWGLLILLIIFTSFGFFARYFILWSNISLLVVLVSGILAWWKGFRPAKFFMVSWLALVASLLALETVRLGVLPSNMFTENVFQPAFAIMALGWSLALADRINSLKDQSELSIQKLQQGESKLSQILDGVPLGIVVYGQDQKPEYSNKRALEILSNPGRNIQAEVSAGRSLAQALEYFSLHIAGTKIRYPIDKIPIFAALLGQAASVDDLEADLVDRTIPLEMWASPIIDANGNVEGAVGAFQDISERREAEAELTAYRKHLERIVEEKTQELRLHVAWLEAVNLVNQTIASSSDFAQICENIFESACQVFQAQNAFIAELDGLERELKIVAHSCHSDQHPALIGSIMAFSNEIPSYQDIDPGEVYVATRNQFAAIEGPMGEHVHHSGLQSIAIISLRIRDEVLGFLGLELNEEGRRLTQEEKHLLNIFSTDIAQVLLNKRLFEQSKSLTAADERNRLARQLHDSVAQALYSINLYSNAIRLARNHNNLAVINEHVEEITKLAKEAMTDMRLLIYQLRPPILEEEGLVVALQNRLDSVETRTGINAGIETKGKFDLTHEQESELYWIAQEILNNISKHAHANEVLMQLIGDEKYFQMVIEDNGVGFELESAEQSGRQGLRNIRERAEKIEATCEILSKPGEGTKITIELST